jgi:cobalt-zinc-cadmium efflux system membrane fusion protein
MDYVASVMDEKSRTVKIRINLANPDGRLRPGMFATVNLELPGRQEALSVPSSAILSNEGRDFVFVHRDGNYFLRRPIVRGIEQNGRTEVMLGLEAGQTVVADGAFLLKSDVLRSKMGAGCAD